MQVATAADHQRRRGVAALLALTLALALTGLSPQRAAHASAAPDAPTSLAATPGDERITVSFTLPSGACPPCTVVVEAATDADFVTVVGSASGTSSPLVINGLANGVAHHVRAYVLSLEGGEVSEFTGDGTIGGVGLRYRIHRFGSVGDTTLTVHDRPLGVEALIVGGGGGGGVSAGGGGGGGGVILDLVVLTAGSSTVTVGAGGDSENVYAGSQNGQPSMIAGLTAFGGGGGANMCNGPYPCPDGRDGGSGGGGSRVNNTSDATGTAGGAATQAGPDGYGNAGGRGIGTSGTNTQGGGGGGAGAAGSQPTSTNTAGFGGNGGDGLQTTITGAALTYAGGGGGGVGSSFSRAGVGGSGGGGDGAVSPSPTTTAPGQPGVDGLGGGGGGGSARDGGGSLGGRGGDGVVILRHIFNVAVLSGTVTPAAPEVLAPEVEAPTTLTLACPPDVPRVETLITCTVTGGDGATAVLWRASFGETFAGAGVSLGPTGTGTFSFSVPRTALGRELVVELVDWSAPLSLGTVEGPVPASIPSGGGPAATTAALIAIAAVLVGGASRRRSARSRG